MIPRNQVQILDDQDTLEENMKKIAGLAGIPAFHLHGAISIIALQRHTA